MLACQLAHTDLLAAVTVSASARRRQRTRRLSSLEAVKREGHDPSIGFDLFRVGVSPEQLLMEPLGVLSDNRSEARLLGRREMLSFLLSGGAAGITESEARQIAGRFMLGIVDPPVSVLLHHAAFFVPSLERCP